MTWMWVAGLVLGGVGLAGLVWGLVGRTVRVGPHCRKCRFDLGGTRLDAEGVRCPECGRGLGFADAVMPRLRRRRVGVVAGSVAVLLIAGALGSAYGVQRFAGYNWRQHMPSAWLVREATRSQDHEAADAALAELLLRLEADELSERHVRTLVGEAVVRYEDEYSYWSPGWGTVAGEAWGRDVLSEEQKTTLLRNVADPPEIRYRPVIRQGDWMPMQSVDGVQRPIEGLVVEVSQTFVLIDDEGRITQVGRGGTFSQVQSALWRRSLGQRGYGSGGSIGQTRVFEVRRPDGSPTYETFLSLPASPGQQRLRFGILEIIGPKEASIMSRRIGEVGRTLEEIKAASPATSIRVIPVEIDVYVYPEGSQDDMRLVSSKDVDASIVDSLYLEPIGSEADSSGDAANGQPLNARSRLFGTDQGPPREAMVAAHVVVYVDDQRWYLGTSQIPAGNSHYGVGLRTFASRVVRRQVRGEDGEMRYVLHAEQRIPDDLQGPFEPIDSLFDHAFVDVHLVPAMSVARDSLQITPVWNRIAVFRNVPVSRESSSRAFTTNRAPEDATYIAQILDADTGEVVWERPPEAAEAPEKEAPAPSGG